MTSEQQHLHTAVRNLTRHPTIQVAFALDRDGALVAWSGRSSAFSQTGQFPSLEKGREPDQNLYLTLVGVYYIGVMFADGVPLEGIRHLVDEQETELATALGLSEPQQKG